MKVLRAINSGLNDSCEMVYAHDLGNIHQTLEWGKFQSTNPGREKFWMIQVVDKEKVIGAAMIVRMALPFRKCWLMCPRGPICDYKNPEVFRKIVQECVAIAEEENCVYLRFELPIIKPADKEFVKMLREIGFEKAHVHHQPEDSLLIDLTKDEEQILAQMKQKGRYNIKVAKKHGLSVREGKLEEVEKFRELMRTTTKRNKFHAHGLEFYKNMLENLNGDGEKVPLAKLYLAEYQGDTIAAMIATFYAGKAVYYYGASGNNHRNLMAPYLLQWEVMREAKRRGCIEYDLFGIAPEGSKNHPWRQITEFKTKFGGRPIEYFPAQEKILQRFWYLMMRLAKFIRGNR